MKSTNYSAHSATETKVILDPAEIRKLFPRFVGYVTSRMRCVRRRQPTEADVEDMVQDVLEAAVRGREWPEGADLWGYLTSIVWSVLTDQNRSERRRREAALALPFDAVAEPPAPASRREPRIYAARCIEAIKDCVAPEPELSALVAAVLDGDEEYSEIARALGCDEARVDTLFRRLRRRIDRAGLRPWSDDEERT
jgi:DNA-directed RNA polymerase specialized sigma24 family protein